jgi:hypothetical protein
MNSGIETLTKPLYLVMDTGYLKLTKRETLGPVVHYTHQKGGVINSTVIRRMVEEGRAYLTMQCPVSKVWYT